MAVSLNIENVLSLPISDSYYTSNLPSSDIRQLASPRIEISQFIDSTSSGRFEVYNNGLLSITLEQTMMMSSYHVVDELRIKNVASGIEQVMGVAMMQQMSLCIGYDEATHVTYYLFGGKDPWGSWNQVHKYDSSGWSSTIKEALYEAVIGSIPVLYNWSSVSSISGKNGTLSLTKILNINDGEPVQDITNKGNLDFSKKTKVNTLVSSVYEPTHKEDATKAIAIYEIPDKTYAYCTLVYKENEIPTSVEDGTAIPIDPDGEEISISGLEERTTYYFVIFTNKTTSEPYRFKTGKNAPEEGIFKIKVTIDKSLLDNDIKDFASYERIS